MTTGAAPIATPLGLLARRPRTDDDVGLLRALFAASRRDELALMGWGPEEQQSFVDLQLRAREQHREATRPDAVLGIVTLDDVSIGQLDVERTAATVEIIEIAIVPGLQGHGLGTALLAQVLDEADAAGLPAILNVEPANPARRLYERHGFVVTGTAGPLHLAMERPVGGTAPSATEPPVETPRADPGVAVDLDPALVAHAVPTYDELAPHVGATVSVGGDGPDLELVDVTARPRPGHEGSVPYSALLAGPVDHPLDQGIYQLGLPTGAIALFIVPLAPRDGRALYELIVS